MPEYDSLEEIAQKIKDSDMLLMQQGKQDYQWNLKISLTNLERMKLLSM